MGTRIIFPGFTRRSKHDYGIFLSFFNSVKSDKGNNTQKTLVSSVVEPEPRGEEPKLNLLSEPEPKLQIAAPAPQT
jgi:hypothetical protein